MAAMAPGILAGPPISGAILSFQSAATADSRNERYLGLQMFCGATLLVGAFFAVAARFVVDRRMKQKV